MLHTHGYDQVAKLGSIALGFCGWYWVLGQLGRSHLAFDLVWGQGGTLLGTALFLGLVRTLGSLAYCRFSLRARFTFAQARQLNNVLSPLNSMTWCPLGEVRHAPRDEQFAVAARAAGEWLEERRRFRRERDRRLGGQRRTLRIVRAVLTGLIIFGVVGGNYFVPPTDQLAALLATFSDDGTVDPMLNGIIAAVIPAILLHVVNARAGVYPDHVSYTTQVKAPARPPSQSGDETSRQS